MPEIPEPEDIEALADRVDPDSREVFLSVHADLEAPGLKEQLGRRHDEIVSALEGSPELLENFQAAWEQARELLDGMVDQAARGASVFTSPEHGLAEGFALAEPVETSVVLDSSPYVRPLARFLDSYEDLAVMLVDGEHATIHLVEAGRAQQVTEAETDLAGRHTKGGLSQMRFQRHRETELRRFLDEVIDRLERLVREEDVEQVFIAGSGQVKDQLANRLPPQLADRVTAVEAVDLDEDPSEGLLAGFVELSLEQEAESSLQAVDALRAGLKRGELATTDPFEVARAARDGRVDLLVVLEGHHPAGAKCEEHETVFEQGDRCECGASGTPVDLANEAVEDVAGADGRVEFVEGEVPVLAKAGGVGALLRW